jgi:hypothetical protein
MWIKEISLNGDTGYYEVTDLVDICGFDAGGGLYGLEITYDPTEDFIHGSMIYVRIEVYDLSYDPNFIHVDYWFEVIQDYKAPYLENLSPAREEDFVPVSSSVCFDIVDLGAGVDINSLEFLINSRLVSSSYLSIYTINKNRYTVTYTPNELLYYGKRYNINVKVLDRSSNENRLIDSYRFYTEPSSGVNFTAFDPAPCRKGESLFRDVSVIVIADGNGIDKNSIKLQVFDKDVNPKLVPIVYRIC